MSEWNREALRGLAEKATPGPWVALGGYLAAEVGTCTCAAPPEYAHEGGCGLEDFGQTTAADAAYIAAIDPATLTALLDEYDALVTERDNAQRVATLYQREIKRLTAWMRELHAGGGHDA